MAMATRDMATDTQDTGILRETTTAVIQLTERLTTLGDRTTTAAVALTSIISIIITAIKADGLV